MNTDEISVVIPTYNEPINFVSECINSLLRQENICEIIIIDSSKNDEIKQFCQCIKSNDDNNINYVYTPPRGLSDARNKGINIATKDIVAFIDADGIADNDWAKNIYSSFTEGVAIVGGKIIPKWIIKPNKILGNSAIAQGFYSLFDMGEEMEEVSQVFGCNFAIRKSIINGQLFVSSLGRKKGNLLSGEETDFCRRIREKNLKVIYSPSVIVWHQIPEERTKFSWIWNRMYYGGVTRVMLGGSPTPKAVNVRYNLYDVLFLAIFITPYLYGAVSTKARQILRGTDIAI